MADYVVSLSWVGNAQTRDCKPERLKVRVMLMARAIRIVMSR